jgi:kynureninase
MDPFLPWRNEFPIVERCTYLVSHSLGAMPLSAIEGVNEYLDVWNQRGVRAWSEGWWEIGGETGDLLAPILGVPAGSVSMHQNVTVAQGIVASCHRFDGPRRKIVLSDLEFPSNHYLYEGFRRYGAETVYVPPAADGLRVDVERIVDAIDEQTLLVPISLVFFKSGHLIDPKPIVEKAHRVGARVVLDVYQAAGTVPMGLGALEVDFAVGGSVKWLCGGPGAGYLYVRPDLAPALQPALTGWAAHAEPFLFEPGPTRYAESPARFQTGTPNVPGLYAAQAGYRIIAKIGVEAIREKSLRLTGRLMEMAEARGYRVRTPAADAERGGTVTLDMPEAAAVAGELLRRDVIIDHRPGAGIRMAPHFYTTDDDIGRAMGALDEIAAAVEF